MLLSIHYKTGEKFIKTYIVHIVNFHEILSGFGFLNMQCSLKILIFLLTPVLTDQFTKKTNKNSTKLTFCNNYFHDGSTAAAKGFLDNKTYT